MSKWDDWDCEVTQMRYLYFDRGLETVLKTSNVTNYPTVCASATASFSVFSETISVIDIILKDKHHHDDLSRVIAILQTRHEKQKLSLTAALHLERICEQNQMMNTTEGDAQVTKLLNEGVTTIRQRVSKCVEGINDALEEL
jgi:DNA repair REX1-B